MTYDQLLMTDTVRLFGIEQAALPCLLTLRDRATDDALRSRMDEEATLASERVRRLESACVTKEWPLKTSAPPMLQGLQREVREAFSGVEDGPVLDAAIAALARKLACLRATCYDSGSTLAAGDLVLARTFAQGAEDARSLDHDLECMLRDRLVPAARADGGQDPDHPTRR